MNSTDGGRAADLADAVTPSGRTTTTSAMSTADDAVMLPISRASGVLDPDHPGATGAAARVPDDGYVPVDRNPYTYAAHFVQNTSNASVYDVAFCTLVENYELAATVCKGFVNVFYIDDGKIKPFAQYVDPEPKEDLFAVTWAYSQYENSIVVVVGGNNAVLRVVHPFTGRTLTKSSDHGDVINEIKTHPQETSIVASASKDLTIRIFEVNCGSCLAILGGMYGHLDQIISASFDDSGSFIVSGSMDHTVKIWDIGSEPEIVKRIKAASIGCPKCLEPVEVTYPCSDSRDLHANYVDCVQFLGVHVISKASENRFVISKFGHFDDPCPAGGRDVVGTETLSQKISSSYLPNAEMWFIKFDITKGPPGRAWFACGNLDQRVLLWDLWKRPISKKHDFELHHSCLPKVVRKIAFSRDGSYMLAVGGEGKICLFARDDTDSSRRQGLKSRSSKAGRRSGTSLRTKREASDDL